MPPAAAGRSADARTARYRGATVDAAAGHAVGNQPVDDAGQFFCAALFLPLHIFPLRPLTLLLFNNVYLLNYQRRLFHFFVTHKLES
jgi:hypothetical protein